MASKNENRSSIRFSFEPRRFLKKRLRGATVCLSAALFGCASAQDYVDAYATPSPTVDNLSVCHGYGCRWRSPIYLTSPMQAEIANLYNPAPKDALDERMRLARAIALFEIRVGAALGTDKDRYAATAFNLDPGQLDCIDETVNTTTYMRLLKGLGLMRFHEISKAAQRGALSGFTFSDFITNTAVVVESGTGAAYAVDSYFYANGREPAIMPLAQWRRGWRPRLDDPNLEPLPRQSP